MTELVDVLEDQYLAALAQRSAKWQVQNPAEAKAIRETVRLQYAIVGKPDPEPDTLRWQVFEAAVNEAVRVKAGWPSARTVIREKLGAAPAPYNAPTLNPAPAVDRFDHKAASAGDR